MRPSALAFSTSWSVLSDFSASSRHACAISKNFSLSSRRVALCAASMHCVAYRTYLSFLDMAADFTESGNLVYTVEAGARSFLEGRDGSGYLPFTPYQTAADF